MVFDHQNITIIGLQYRYLRNNILQTILAAEDIGSDQTAGWFDLMGTLKADFLVSYDVF